MEQLKTHYKWTALAPRTTKAPGSEIDCAAKEKAQDKNQRWKKYVKMNKKNM